MAKKTDARTFNISVIGLSGTEREKGASGIGKSCLCNRFIHQVADKYHYDHISVLSQSDFAGRVINNDHFLYWGEAVKTDEGNNFTFHVIEQTEFIDDVSFQPFKTGRTDPYHKRCVATKVQSAEKLMYICKEQLGMETDSAYEQKLMPDGKLITDGFLCCFDVSRYQQRPIEKQVEFVSWLLNNAVKTKKPVVIVTTKTEESEDKYLKEVEKLVSRREYKGAIPLVESSAHANVNVELAFMTLAHLIEKTRGRTKIASFTEAKRARDEILEVATEAYKNLLRVQVVDAKCNWHAMKKKLEKEADFGHFIDLYGTDSARKLFREHTKHLRDEQVRRREQHYLTLLPDVLQHFLPDICNVSDSWTSCQRFIRRHKDFNKYFVEIGDNIGWKDSELVENYEETRIPFDMLNSSEADTCYRNHHNALQAEYRKMELKKQFKKMLEENPQVIPGKSLEETYVFFIGKDCYNNLHEYERQQVYELHQAELKLEAKQQLQELLWEKSEVFTGLSPTARLTQEDLKGISIALQDDVRYKRLDRLEEDRKVVILNHLGFMQCPSKDRCYFKESCVESQLPRILQEYKSRKLAESGESDYNNDEKLLNLVLLGNEDLSTELYKEIRVCYPGDRFVYEHNVHNLDYRPIDGDVSLEQNAIATANFKPHGCLCVYYCQTSLDYIRNSLNKLLLADISREDGQSLQGLPMAVIHAYNPGASPGELQRLTQLGKELAKRFQLAFVDIPEDDLLDKRKFYSEQLEQALSLIVGGNTLQGGLWPSSSEPELRILVCMMCGDPYPIDIPLGPLLNTDPCFVSATENTVVIDKHLDFVKQRIEISVSSYHGENIEKSDFYHGYILVYSVKRKASLATMRAFASYLPPVPVLILAVTDSTVSSAFFSDELSQSLISDGVSIADELHAKLMVTTANFQQQTAVFLPFFKEAWDRREQTESFYNDPSPPAYDDRMLDSLDQRPPAPLPKGYDVYQTTKSSTSNSQSTEDSEPLYDHPVYPEHDQSDSEQDRASSDSPPPVRPSSPNSTNYHYREGLSENNNELLVRPSMVKSRREMYAAWAIHEQHREKRAAFFTYSTVDDNAGSQNSNDELEWTENELYWSQHTDPKYRGKPTPLDMRQIGPFVNMMQQNQKQGRKSKVIAPLAVPEPIEIADYGLPKDTVHFRYTDNDYALVDDALPAGQVFRIKSNKKEKVAGTTDSEDSEFSSLERDKKPTVHDSVAKKPIPHKKKHRQRQYDTRPYAIHVLTEDSRNMRHCELQAEAGERVHSNSPSEGSEGTGDEVHTGNKERKRRSVKHKKYPAVPPEMIAVTMSPTLSDSDTFVGSPSHSAEHHYEPVHEFISYPTPTSDDMEFDLNDSGHWKDRFKIPRGGGQQKDTLRLKKKEEKRQKDDERRRQKEEERKQKEQQKLQKKGKKKDGKSSVTSESGNRLEDYPMSPSNLSVPHFIERCVEFIEIEGLIAEGIYRIPGNKAQVDLLQNKFNEDANVDIGTLDIQVNAVATVLKTFFNNLTDPLVPPVLYDELIEAAGVQDKSSRLLALRGVLKKLHPLNYEVLKFLITHLHRVGQHADKNSMDSNNLARCWWPTILRMEFTSFEKMTMFFRIPEEIVQMMIEQCGFFFHGENEV